MTTITAPTLSQQSLAAGMVAIISAPVRGQALVQVTASGAIVAQAVIGTGQTQRFGPYTAATTVNVRADDGSIEYTANPPDTLDWAELLATTGDYDGQRKRVRFSGSVPFWMEWSASDAAWWPANGEQPYYFGTLVAGAIATDTNSSGTQTLNFPSLAHPVNFWRPGLGMAADIFGETSISATARSLNLTITGDSVVNLPTAANRRVSGRFGFMADTPTTAYGFTKKDAAEYDFPQSANSNMIAIAPTGGWAAALTVGGTMSFTTAAAAATANLKRFKLSLVRG